MRRESQFPLNQPENRSWMGKVALAMTDSILRHIGSTPAQLDEMRQWIRTRLFAANGEQECLGPAENRGGL